MEALFSFLSDYHGSAGTLLSARAAAGHSYGTEGAEFSRRIILVSVSRAGQSHPMARDRVVQVDNPQPRTCMS